MDPFALRVKLFTGLDQLWSSAGKPKLERCIKGTGVAIFFMVPHYTSFCGLGALLVLKKMLKMNTWMKSKGIFRTFGGYIFHSEHCTKHELCDIQETNRLWPLVPELKYCQSYYWDHSLGSLTETILTYTVSIFNVHVLCDMIMQSFDC